MLIGNESTPRSLEAMDGVETTKKPYRDRYVRHSHDMSEETAEASARMLIRAVPMIYGVLLGGLAEHMPIGISVGFALMAAVDMRMREHSIFLPMLAPLLAPLCSLINAAAHSLAKSISLVGLRPPTALANLHCRIPGR